MLAGDVWSTALVQISELDGETAGSVQVSQRGPFYGWVVVGAVFFILLFSSGLGFYNASVILAAATDELGASVAAVSGATGVFFAVGGLTGFALSKWMDTSDLRVFFTAGGVVGAVALYSLRWVTNVAGLYLFFALFGVGFGLAGLVPSTTVVTRWFDRRRSVALSVASTGLSVGGIVLTPVAAWLIDQRSLSDAGPVMALIWFVGIVPVALLLVRSDPSERGLQPDGEVESPMVDQPDQSQPNQVKTVLGLDFASARKTRFFIALCAAYCAIFFGQVGGIAQLFKMVQERTDVAVASTALSALAFSSVLARLIGGALVLKVSTKWLGAVLVVLQSAALILLAVSQNETALIMSAAFFGISIGNLLMLQPLLLAEVFGVANYSRIYSFNQLFGTIGVAGGPLLLGVLRDAFDYRIAFFVAAGATFTGFLFFLAAGDASVVQHKWKPEPTVSNVG